MLRIMPLDFVRQAIEQTLFEEHLKDINFFGGDNEIKFASFYEQLKTDKEVERFKETYRDIVNEQNRTGLIGAGILQSPENPTMTNIHSALIVPFTWTASVRCQLKNRDKMIWSLQNMIDKLKGHKCDMAQLKCKDMENQDTYKPFKVGTLGQGTMSINSGDFIGTKTYNQDTDTRIKSLINTNVSLGLSNYLSNGNYLYFVNVGAYGLTNELRVARLVNGVGDIQGNSTIANVSINTSTRVVSGDVVFTSTNDFEHEVAVNVVIGDIKATDGTYTYTFPQTITQDDGIVVSVENNKLKVVAPFEIEIDASANINNITLSTQDFIAKSQTNNWFDIEDDGTYTNIVFPPEHTDIEKYKLSLSFESFRVDQPNTLNGEEYCNITFGGSATLVSEKVALGNDLIYLSVQKNKILADTDIVFSNAQKYYLEPMEMPSGLNANTQINQLISNNFKQNTHTDGVAGVLQYTFIYDESKDILKQWFNYSRYGSYGIDVNSISPNMIYNVSEYWSSWGNFVPKTILGKIVESIDIENTESDVLTLGVTFQIQGANN